MDNRGPAAGARKFISPKWGGCAWSDTGQGHAPDEGERRSRYNLNWRKILSLVQDRLVSSGNFPNPNTVPNQVQSCHPVRPGKTASVVPGARLTEKA